MRLYVKNLACYAAMFLPAGLNSQQIASTSRESSVQGGSTASITGPLERTLTIDLSDVPLRMALDEIISKSGVPISYSRTLVPVERRVNVRGSNISLTSALRQLLAGTGMEARISHDRKVIIVQAEQAARKGQGVIMGKTTDARTGKGLSGVTISIGGEARGVTTSDDGSYRLTGISNGTHTIVVRLVGYARQSRSVTLGDGGIVTADFKLEPSANVLDQVIVTGTVAQTELKAVPNAITVITAKQIEERGITRIDQLFRGEIPGLFAQNQGSYVPPQGSNEPMDRAVMFSRGATALSLVSGGVTVVGNATNTNAIKTYIDGVEMADPQYLTHIDPKSIDRIEILTGPQASTIYGSNAINGVMQIFTKRGSSARPQLSLSLLSGWVENNFSTAHTPNHDYDAQLAGMEGRFSYNMGGSWNYMGPWTPAKQTTRLNGFGGSRLELPTSMGRVTADMTIRRSNSHNRQKGSPEQRYAGYVESGWYLGPRVTDGMAGVNPQTIHKVSGQTLGIALGYVPASWWSHDIVLGQDIESADSRVISYGYKTVSDTTMSINHIDSDRRSIRYTTTIRIPVTGLAELTTTLGADGWRSSSASYSGTPQTLSEAFSGGISPGVEGHNSGGLLQTQLGLLSKVYLTYGLRAEWNPNLGDEAQPNYAPRYGIAYTEDLGPLTAKVRASYGRSTRPPQRTLKVGQTARQSFGTSWPTFYEPFYTNFDLYVTNLELGPEYQQGGEGGLELYLGNRGSLVVTRYNQTVDGLIAQATVDTARSDIPCAAPCQANYRDPDGYGYIYQKEYVNLGSIRNQGWELQGNINLGPISTRGTYSWTKSRTLGITPKYRALFSPTAYPQYQPGAAFQYFPEHTWALGFTYAHRQTVLALNFDGIGRATNSLDDFYMHNLTGSIRLMKNRQNIALGNFFNNYVQFNKGYAMGHLAASHRLSPRMEGVLQVRNLTDWYKNDYDAQYASMGRQTKIGLRMRFQ